MMPIRTTRRSTSGGSNTSNGFAAASAGSASLFVPVQTRARRSARLLHCDSRYSPDHVHEQRECCTGADGPSLAVGTTIHGVDGSGIGDFSSAGKEQLLHHPGQPAAFGAAFAPAREDEDLSAGQRTSEDEGRPVLVTDWKPQPQPDAVRGRRILDWAVQQGASSGRVSRFRPYQLRSRIVAPVVPPEQPLVHSLRRLLLTSADETQGPRAAARRDEMLNPLVKILALTTPRDTCHGPFAAAPDVHLFNDAASVVSDDSVSAQTTVGSGADDAGPHGNGRFGSNAGRPTTPLSFLGDDYHPIDAPATAARSARRKGAAEPPGEGTLPHFRTAHEYVFVYEATRHALHVPVARRASGSS